MSESTTGTNKHFSPEDDEADTTDSSQTSNRLPVSAEDRQIDAELFSDEPPHDVPIKRISGATAPGYLTKSYYDPEGRGEAMLSHMAELRAKKALENDYPKYVCRNIAYLYEVAERAFERWWAHLEDDFCEVNEEAAKQRYLQKFLWWYSFQAGLLDGRNPEHAQAYNEKHYAAIEKHLSVVARSGAQPDPGDDFRTNNPRWRQNVAAQGRAGGVEAAEEDREIGIGFKRARALEKLAWERLAAWWRDMSVMSDIEEQTRAFDFVTSRTIYVHNFTKTYTENAADGPGPGAARVRIANVRHLEDVRVYTIKLTDPDYRDDPILFEVAKELGNDPILREVTGDQ